MDTGTQDRCGCGEREPDRELHRYPEPHLHGVSRLVLLVTSPRVAPGLLSAAGVGCLQCRPGLRRRSRRTACSGVGRRRGDGVARLGAACGQRRQPRGSLLDRLGYRAPLPGWSARTVTRSSCDAVTEIGAASLGDGDAVEIQLVHGSWDLPGARLLDVVPRWIGCARRAGCPWDAQQDHQTLAPYLLEEAYEAFQAIEDDDSTGCGRSSATSCSRSPFMPGSRRSCPRSERWTIDDVAARSGREAGTPAPARVRRHGGGRGRGREHQLGADQGC